MVPHGHHGSGGGRRPAPVALIEKLEPLVHVLVAGLLLHLGTAEVGAAEGRQVAQGLALLLQRHDAVFLKHDERLKCHSDHNNDIGGV